MRAAFDSFASAIGDSTLVVQGEALPTPVRVLQAFYRCIADDDFGTLRTLLTEDVTFQLVGPPPLGGGHGSGRETVLAIFRQSFALIEPSASTVESLVVQGDTLVMIATDQGVMHLHEGPMPYALRFILEITYRDGCMARIREFVGPLE